MPFFFKARSYSLPTIVVSVGKKSALAAFISECASLACTLAIFKSKLCATESCNVDDSEIVSALHLLVMPVTTEVDIANDKAKIRRIDFRTAISSLQRRLRATHDS